MKLGVLCATEREFETIQSKMIGMREEEVLGRRYYVGDYEGKSVVVSRCGVGKVSSALAIAGFVERFHCDRVLFLGTAGALAKDLRVGDVVVSSACVQHDFDGRPFVDRCIVFAVGKRLIEADAAFADECKAACEKVLASSPLSESVRADFQIT